MTDEQRAQLRAFGLTVAIVLAPFLALAFGLNAALGVLAVALAATTFLCWHAAEAVGPATRGRLRAAAALNGGLAVAVLLLLTLRLLYDDDPATHRGRTHASVFGRNVLHRRWDKPHNQRA